DMARDYGDLSFCVEPEEVEMERLQLFIGTHNEPLSVVRCASAIQIVRPLESMAETHPNSIRFAQFPLHTDMFGGSFTKTAHSPCLYKFKWNPYSLANSAIFLSRSFSSSGQMRCNSFS